MLRYIIFLFALSISMLTVSAPSVADCTNPAGKEGQQTYNLTYKTMQFCDGTYWYSMKNGGASGFPVGCQTNDTPVFNGTAWVCSSDAPVECSSPGELCFDGSIYAGWTVGETPLYVTDVHQGQHKWSTAGSANYIDPDSNTDGLANHNNRSGTLSDFPAFQVCENLDRHGHTDWYLPSQNELNELYLYRALINNSAQEDIYTDWTWSSTEPENDKGRVQLMGNGVQALGIKGTAYGVRCVRRDYVPPSDPNWNNVVLLLKGEGTNGATSIGDSSVNNLSATRVGSAVISTAQKKFGSSSIYFPSGGCFYYPANAAFNFGTGDFTVEGWVYFTTSSGQSPLRVSVNSGTYGAAAFYTTSSLLFYSSSNGSAYDIAHEKLVGTISLNTWHHFAVTRSGNTFRTFLNGIQGTSFTNSSSVMSGEPTVIGAATSSCTSSMNSGYVDEIRITKGVARYTSNFTPPTEEFPDN